MTGQTSSGYVSLTPTPTATPTTSTINFPKGDARANGLTVPLSPTGQVAAVFKGSSGARAHLILDVTGYYLPGTSGLRFYPLEPGRILDTRATSLTLLTGKSTAGAPRTLATGGHFGVPNDAQAVTGNLTVTGQSQGRLRVGHPDQDEHADRVDDQLPGRRHAGERDHGAARRQRRLSTSCTSPRAARRRTSILDLTGYFR